MGVRLSIEIVSPLGSDDRDMLTGLSIMVMAIANHELAKEHFPGIFPSPEEIAEKQPCSSKDPDDPSRICVSDVRHRGRHRCRTPEARNGLAN